MSIELNEKDFIIKFWHAESYRGSSVLLLLRRCDDEFLVDCRIRQKRDDKIFDSADEKTFYSRKAKPGTPMSVVLKDCEDLWLRVAQDFPCHCFSQVVDGGPDKFIEVLERYPQLFHKMPAR